MASGKILMAAAAMAAALSPAGAIARPGDVMPATGRSGAAAYLTYKCPTTSTDGGGEKGIFDAAAGFVVDFVIKGISTYLEKRKAELNGEFIAATSISNVYGSKGLAFGCLVVVSGEFGPAVVATAAKPSSADLSEDVLAALKLTRQPDFYLEARARLDHGDALTLQPVYLRYGATSAARSRTGKKNVAAIIGMSTASLATDTEISEDNSFAVFRFNLGELEIGKTYNSADYFPGLSAVQSLPAPLSENGEPIARPANVFAFVAETEDPSLALELLASTFEDNKDDLSSALETILTNALKPEAGGK